MANKLSDFVAKVHILVYGENLTNLLLKSSDDVRFHIHNDGMRNCSSLVRFHFERPLMSANDLLPIK